MSQNRALPRAMARGVSRMNDRVPSATEPGKGSTRAVAQAPQTVPSPAAPRYPVGHRRQRPDCRRPTWAPGSRGFERAPPRSKKHSAAGARAVIGLIIRLMPDVKQGSRHPCRRPKATQLCPKCRSPESASHGWAELFPRATAQKYRPLARAPATLSRSGHRGRSHPTS